MDRSPSSETNDPAATLAAPCTGRDVTRLRDLSPQQWKSGIAAWLGWLFDGLDMHIYTLVATPFVAQLLVVHEKHDDVRYYSSIIQASFLVGWALGGGLFGRIGDRLGRARALNLTILTYAVFTGLSFFAQTWWHLMIFRFLAALGIGGEWAVGASLLSESWPRRWRPWIAAVLQSAVNIGVILAMVAGVALAALPPRYVFLVGILPAFLVFWIRRAVPEPEEWRTAKQQSRDAVPRIVDLFRGTVLRTTVLTVSVCALALSAHWAFTYWSVQHFYNLPETTGWTDGDKRQFQAVAMTLLMVTSILGNFAAGFIARHIGYRKAIASMCVAYFCSMYITYHVPRPYETLFWMLSAMGACSGLFGLFTMYLPPLFPTLLRTTGAGFCYNIGRIAAAAGTVCFGMFSKVGDHRLALLYSAYLFLPAALVALLLSEPPDETAPATPADPGQR